MKKMICVMLLVLSLSSLLTGCFTCDTCGESNLITSKNEVLGLDVCDDCLGK